MILICDCDNQCISSCQTEAHCTHHDAAWRHTGRCDDTRPLEGRTGRSQQQVRLLLPALVPALWRCLPCLKASRIKAAGTPAAATSAGTHAEQVRSCAGVLRIRREPTTLRGHSTAALHVCRCCHGSCWYRCRRRSPGVVENPVEQQRAPRSGWGLSVIRLVGPARAARVPTMRACSTARAMGVRKTLWHGAQQRGGDAKSNRA
jgi:hypothetical protein